MAKNERYTIELSGFDLDIVLQALSTEHYERLKKTPWANRSSDPAKPYFWYDENAKPVRQVMSTIRYINRQVYDQELD